MTIYGLDCSNHQGNMTTLAGFSASFFCHKLTEGTSYIDPNAAHNLAFARSQRVPVLGGYHYIRAGNGAGQADYFADRAHTLFGRELRGFLWQLDCEQDAGYADVKAFVQRWHAQTGAPILFYTGDWWLQPRGWNVKALGFAGLWAAPNRGYVGKAQNVKSADWAAGYGGFDKLTIAQYDARSSIGDTNQYAGTLAQLRKLLGGTTTTPGGFMSSASDYKGFIDYLVKNEAEAKRFARAIAVTDGVVAQIGADGKYPPEGKRSYMSIAGALGNLRYWAMQGASPDRLAAAIAPLLAPLLPTGNAPTQADLETALRTVLGSLDNG